MRHQVLRLATLLSLGGAAMMVLITVALPEQSALSAAASIHPMQVRAARLLYRRQFNEKVLTECQRRVTEGETVDCPDINDIDAIREFLSGDEEVDVEEHSAAVMLTKDDLNDQQLALLRRLQRVGTCPDSLDTILPGFYQLCILTVGPSGEHGTMQRLLNNIPESAPQGPTWTLEERIEQNKRARPDK